MVDVAQLPQAAYLDAGDSLAAHITFLAMAKAALELIIALVMGPMCLFLHPRYPEKQQVAAGKSIRENKFLEGYHWDLIIR